MTTKRKKVDLPKPLPCPFCGNTDGFRHKYSPLQKVYWIECPNCLIQGPPHADESDSISIWNIRLYEKTQEDDYRDRDNEPN